MDVIAANLPGAGLFLLQVAAGILLADLISGVLHWWEDTYGDPKWPVIGPAIIAPNILHHSEPLAFTRSSYWRRNRIVFIIAALFGLAFWALGWINPLTVTMLIAGAHANEIHVWSHIARRKRPALVRWLQDKHVLLTPQEHWAHHSGAFNKRYCTITNLVNPVLDKLRVFRIVEGWVEGWHRRRPRDEEMGIAPLARGRRALSRARRFVAALGWAIRRNLSQAGHAAMAA